MRHQIEVIITHSKSKDRVMLDPCEDFETFRFLSVWISDFCKNMQDGDRISFQVHPFQPNLPFL